MTAANGRAPASYVLTRAQWERVQREAQGFGINYSAECGNGTTLLGVAIKVRDPAEIKAQRKQHKRNYYALMYGMNTASTVDYSKLEARVVEIERELWPFGKGGSIPPYNNPFPLGG